MKYIITEIENNLIEKNSKIFSIQDAEVLIENSKVFENFIGTLQAGYRSSLALGEAKDNEKIIYNYVDCLEDLKMQINELGNKMKEYRQKEIK